MRACRPDQSQKLCGTTCIPANGCCTSDDCPSGQCQTCGAANTCVTTCGTGQVCDTGGQCVCAAGTCGQDCAQTVCADGVCRQGEGATCTQHADCCSGYCDVVNGVCATGLTCDCSNLNFCSGHGRCLADCSCDCTPPYFGAACDQLPPVDCTAFADCATCLSHQGDNCIFCATTIDNATEVCVSSDNCIVPDFTCTAG